MKKAIRKPNVAFSNEAAAEKNIITKLETLECALKDARDAMNVRGLTKSLTRSDGTQFGFPRSIRQFNLWDEKRGPTFDGLPDVGVVRNSNETLRRYPKYRGRAEVVIAALVELCESLARKGARSPYTLLKNEFIESERLRGLLEAELLVLRRSIRDLTVERDNVQTQLSKLQELFRDEIKRARLEQISGPMIEVKVTKRRKPISE